MLRKLLKLTRGEWAGLSDKLRVEFEIAHVVQPACGFERSELVTLDTDFLRERFPNMTMSDPKVERGVSYSFCRQDEFPLEAFLEFRVKDNDTRQALFVECSMEVEGRFKV
jgi:hypothetical protein